MLFEIQIQFNLTYNTIYMKKHLLICCLSAISLHLNAQKNTEKTLETIETQEQASLFIKENSKSRNSLNGKILTFNEEKHKTHLTNALFKLEKGDVKSDRNEFEKTLYKILDKTKTSYYRLSYILIKGKDYTLESINTLRNTLIDSYKKGTPFSKLANEYSMDDNAKRGGDTGWFATGGRYKALENAILNNNYQQDAIFTIDIPSENTYYLAIQTHEPKRISEIKVLRLIEPIK